MAFLTDLATNIKTWCNGKFQTLLPSQTGNSGKVLGTNGTDLSWVTGGGSVPTLNAALTSLAIDCSLADIFLISISANANFSISNITAMKEQTFIVKNTNASAITVTMPTSQAYASQSVDIGASKARAFSMTYMNSKVYWFVSSELSNA